MTYAGITPDALFLLSQNKFEDSKEFYEAHKAEIKALVFTPMAQLMEALADDFTRLDPQMLLLPSRMISRIRRDTRYTKDKHMYRDNVWMTFMRQKGDWPVLQPLMWFEIKPGEGVWTAGVCAWDQPPAYMRFLRSRIAQGSEEFLAAADAAIAAGAAPQTEPYKKDRAPDAPERLKPYLNAKNFCFVHTSTALGLIENEGIIACLRALYAGCQPMYRWLLAAMEEYAAKNSVSA